MDRVFASLRKTLESAEREDGRGLDIVRFSGLNPGAPDTRESNRADERVWFVAERVRNGRLPVDADRQDEAVPMMAGTRNLARAGLVLPTPEAALDDLHLAS